VQAFTWIDGGKPRNISVRVAPVWAGTCLNFHFFVSGLIIGGRYSALSFCFDLVALNVYRTVCHVVLNARVAMKVTNEMELCRFIYCS